MKIFSILFINSLAAVSLFASEYGVVPNKTDVLIIGAGLSGLSTAYGIKQKSKNSVHILEASPRVGGRVQTVKYLFNGENLYSDSGMEEYWESNPAVQLIQKLKLPVRHDFAASSINLDGKNYILSSDDDPVSFQKKIFNKNELESLEKIKSKMLDISKNVNAHLNELKKVSFAEWVQKNNLPKKVSEWIRISVECEIATSWNAISAIDGIAEFHIFQGKGEESYRIIGGNEIFTNELAKTIGLNNISITKKVTRIVSKGNYSEVYYLDTNSNQSSMVKANYVVSTIPLYRLFEIQFEPALSKEKREAIQSMSYGAYFKAHIFVDNKSSKFWTQNGNSFLPFLTDTDLGVIYDGNPDQKTNTKILSLLIFGSMAEAYNMMSYDDVRTKIKNDFNKFWPGFSQEIKSIEFFRIHPRAVASWPVGRSRFDEQSNLIRKPENRWYFAGDFTESSHSDGAFRSAERVISQITKSKFEFRDLVQPNRELGTAK